MQNGTPVLTLDSLRERLAFNLSLPCGAKASGYGTSGAYTIIEFELTERRGGDCQGAAGQTARGVIRVERGRITEWYRLPTDPGASPAPPAPDERLLDPGAANPV